MGGSVRFLSWSRLNIHVRWLIRQVFRDRCKFRCNSVNVWRWQFIDWSHRAESARIPTPDQFSTSKKKEEKRSQHFITSTERLICKVVRCSPTVTTHDVRYEKRKLFSDATKFAHNSGVNSANTCSFIILLRTAIGDWMIKSKCSKCHVSSSQQQHRQQEHTWAGTVRSYNFIAQTHTRTFAI